MRRPIAVAPLVAMLLLLASAAPSAAPPVARTVEVIDRVHGMTLPDPYRWMEGEKNAELDAWLKAQGEHTRAQLDLSGLAQKWRDRLAAAGSATTLNRLQKRAAGKLFFTREEGDSRGVLMVRDPSGAERTLLDPNAGGAAAGAASVTEYSVSPDGALMAVNVDQGGSEVTTVSLIDVASGLPRQEKLERIWGEFPVVWFPDSSGFSYTQMAADAQAPGSDPMLHMRVRVHRLGEPVEADPVILAEGINERFPLKPEEFPFLDMSASSAWAVATAAGARPEMRVCVARKVDALAPGAPWNCLVNYKDKVQAYALRGSMLYLMTARSAPTGSVVAIDLDRPRRGSTSPWRNARTVLPASPEAVVTGLAMARDGLYARRMTNGIDSFVRLDTAGGPMTRISLPMQGAAYLMSAQPEADGLLFTLQGWTAARRLFAYEPAAARVEDLKLGASSAADYSDISTLETEATSADGTRVPLSIIFRRDMVRDGKALAILEGYGSYGISSQPYFEPNSLEWVKAGYVYAIAHVRGGGEKGSAWWQAGKGPRKFKGVEDFLACAQQLVKLKFSSAGRLAASGASAGGLLIGGAITAQPGQFGAAVIHAGMLNPVRLLSGANGANQIAEVGDPRTAAGLQSLKAMDPVQRIRDGVRYPAVLLAVGTNDSRVSPWESAKFGARLAAATRSERPVSFLVSGDQGHFSGSLNANAAELADTFGFIEGQLSPAR